MTLPIPTPTRLSPFGGIAADPSLEDRLPLLYEELCGLARSQLKRLSWLPTQLEAADLVHEAYLKLARARKSRWNDDRHVLASTVKAMREVLIDRLRHETAQKRGGESRAESIEIDDLPAPGEDPDCHVRIAEAIRRLVRLEPRLARVVQCRALYGMTDAETASKLEVSERTVQRDLRTARGHLRRLEEAGPGA